MGYLSCKSQAATATSRSISAADAESPARAQPRLFPYAELAAATRHFSDDALLGRGSHGAVYRAVIRHPTHVVAVKRPAPTPGREIDNEIEILSLVRNPRIVNVIGFSEAGQGERLLVMEYMPNGTLFELLHGGAAPPSWARRLRLLLQAAKAIHAVHSCDPPIIHRDVKSANVLIDRAFNARLGDFGLALRRGGSAPPAGTLGYLDPGYVTPESLSTKTDVFSFGILLLETMSGRKAIDVAHSPPSIVEWAAPMLRKGRFLDLFDPRIAPLRDPGACRLLARLAAGCVRPAKDRRPGMDQVVLSLKLLCKSLSSKNWASGISVRNPCLVVDSVAPPQTNKPKNSLNDEKKKKKKKNPVQEPAPGEVEEEEEEEEGVSRKSPSSSGAVHPIRNSSSKRNLMDLMMGPDSETLKFIGGRPRMKSDAVLALLDDDFIRLDVG
ncbi:protein kinase superfamily protein [Wolffia australiana]